MNVQSMRTMLESLEREIDAFNKIDRYLSRFNPLTVMRVERMEIRHSAILAWMLDPNGNHGLGATFLHAFLERAQGIRAGVSPTDLADARVWRERDKIDILILCPGLNTVFPIENKVDSRQRKDQLRDTTRKALRIAKAEGQKKPTCQGIFLTLNEEEPEDLTYRQILYRDLVDLLDGEQFLGAKVDFAEQRAFIVHYKEIIEEITGMNRSKNDLIKLAKQIYRKHRAAFDFIGEHAVTSSFTIAAESVFGEEKTSQDLLSPIDVDGNSLGDFRYSFHQQRSYSFVPSGWRDPLIKVGKWPGC